MSTRFAIVYRPRESIALFCPGDPHPLFTIPGERFAGRNPDERAASMERTLKLIQGSLERASGGDVEVHRIEEKPLFPVGKDA
ncbi:MAG TPA: hypothetical protein VEB66_02380 [Opitutaceae bacterium]|nr:hypothetical protein [Opitutaceae bacterium]